MNMEYRVSPDGNILSFEIIEDTETIAIEVIKTIKLPWNRRHGGSGNDKWRKLREAVIRQELNDWYVYSGFSEDSLKKARGHITRMNMTKARHYQKTYKFETSVSKDTNRLAVRKIERIYYGESNIPSS